MAGEQADVPQWTETRAEHGREERVVSTVADGADAERLRGSSSTATGEGHFSLPVTICWKDQERQQLKMGNNKNRALRSNTQMKRLFSMQGNV